MDRRLLLKLMAASAAAGCGREKESARGLKVVVAGAGIVGASIAYHLAKAGAAVTIIDKEGPASHSSRGTFAWINATWAKQPRAYHALSQKGVAGWGPLQKELALPVRWGGSLEWFDSDERQQKLSEQIAEQVEWGEPAAMLDEAAYTELEPDVDFNGVASVAYSPNDGAVDPIAATNALIAAAKKLGAETKFPCEITNVSLSNNRLTRIETSCGTIKADRLVLATGANPDAPRDYAGVDIPQRTTPGVIIITEPTERRFNRIIAAPALTCISAMTAASFLANRKARHRMRLTPCASKAGPMIFRFPKLPRSTQRACLPARNLFRPASAKSRLRPLISAGAHYLSTAIPCLAHHLSVPTFISPSPIAASHWPPSSANSLPMN